MPELYVDGMKVQHSLYRMQILIEKDPFETVSES